MIKNSMIPQRVGSYFLMPTDIVGVDIGKTHVQATKIHAKGHSVIVRDTVRIPIAMGTADYTERAGLALKAALDELHPYTQVITALSSSVVIFKELTVPFTQHNKIELVVGFEVEPLLPFSLEDALVDFIITRTAPDKTGCDIVVAAVQKQHVAQHLAIFQHAGVDPDRVIIDLFALYALFLQLPNRPQTPNVIIIDLGAHATHIGYLYSDQLRLVRSLPYGFADQAKKVSDAVGVPNSHILEHIVRFGISSASDPSHTQALQAIFTQFCNTIGFTIRSFTTQVDAANQETSLVLFGEGTEIKGLPELAAELLHTQTTVFNLQDIVLIPGITFAHKHSLTPAATQSLATALPSPITDLFSVRKKEFESPKTKMVLKKQVYALVFLTVLLLLGPLVNTFRQTRKLTHSLNESQEEIAELLQKHFGVVAEGRDLDDVIQDAQRTLNEEEKIWFSLANPARLSVLHYLLELTNRIDKDGLGFVVNFIKISDDTITLQGRVRDYAALALLEKELRQSPLFAYVEAQDKPEFTMKIRLAKNPRRNQ